MKPLLYASCVILACYTTLHYARHFKTPATDVQHVLEKKKEVLKIFPNPSTDGRFRIVSNSNSQLNFYIFDLDGTLVHQAVLKEKQNHTVQNLKKGIYTFDAFCNDEGVEHGKLIVK